MNGWGSGFFYADVIRIESYSESILCNVIFIARHSYKFYSNLHEEIGVARQGPYKYWIERLVLIILRNPPATSVTKKNRSVPVASDGLII